MNSPGLNLLPTRSVQLLIPLSLLSACALGLAAPTFDGAASESTAQDERPDIPGYAYGRAGLAPSPVSTEELANLQTSLLFGADDVEALRLSAEVLEPQVEEILDVWYGFVGSTPHLLAYFSDPSTGEPDGAYLAAVRKRFGQWILDTAAADYDAEWLAWQHEIGLRHHSTRKPFLAKGDHSPAEVERMHQAWVKAVLLQTILWSHPYVERGAF